MHMIGNGPLPHIYSKKQILIIARGRVVQAVMHILRQVLHMYGVRTE